ncbi:hypothetical protein PR202_ga14639 [Eleusine coracana subsp. coracana]|uniref:Uncharacterized protein n=1 Tax=Eleusine coracana subsp. coracana TaxID=191504 RepID=A0AAV5CI02_ELECO|nr:hypothetical protein QOZ80_6BG0501650 [Eleusine coracana subsp. coracana]GJM97693.1 hypothetical protein PR202_ga14639 [Eleusine coracana subsp. coracana]
MGDQAIAYEPAAVIGAPLPYVHRRFLQAGRVLVTGGWLILTYSTVGNGNRAVNAEHTLIGLAFLLLGVSLIALCPVANRFPRAARAGAAVLLYLFPPARN